MNQNKIYTPLEVTVKPGVYSFYDHQLHEELGQFGYQTIEFPVMEGEVYSCDTNVLDEVVAVVAFLMDEQAETSDLAIGKGSVGLYTNFEFTVPEGATTVYISSKYYPPKLCRVFQTEGRKVLRASEDLQWGYYNEKGIFVVYRPPKVRPKNLTFGGRYFLWLSILLNLN